MYDKLFPTSLVGSYPQPTWLVDHSKLLAKAPPRTRDRSIWKIDTANLEDAQDAATLSAIRDQEEVGLDIVTDGEIRRESYSNHVATALDGIDLDTPGSRADRIGQPVEVPRVTGPIRRKAPIMARDAAFLRRHTTRLAKVTMPGPFTMTMQAQNDYYDSDEDLAMAYAEVIAEEVADIFAAGIDIVQLDEPYMQANPEAARAYAIPAINRALRGATGRTVVHMCFGYAYVVDDKPAGYSFLKELDDTLADDISIEVAQPELDLALVNGMKKGFLIGTLDLGRKDAETSEEVAETLLAAARYLPAERIVAAPDCGTKYLTRELALAKLKAMCEGAALARERLVQNRG